MNTFKKNKKKKAFIDRLAKRPSIENTKDNLTLRSKFNFSYFDYSQKVGQNFKDWDHKQLYELFEKLKEYSKKSLDYMRNERIGGGGLRLFSTYDKFPPKSLFFEPNHVPHQAQWGRFHIGKRIRLIGFTIPGSYHGKYHDGTGEFFDKNTFYIVFLDRDHKFYR